jgi:hypothetical protein
MSSSDLFLIASRKKFRYESEVGELTTEQLWDLPLTSRRGASLNSVAIAANNALKGLAEESFVSTSSDPRRRDFESKLEVIKLVIKAKQDEADAVTQARARAEDLRRIDEAIAAKEGQQLQETSLEELRRKRAALS